MPCAPMQKEVPIQAHVWAENSEYINQMVTLEVYPDAEHNGDWENWGYGTFDRERNVIYAYGTATAYVVATAENGVQAETQIRFLPEYEDFEVPDLLLMHPCSDDHINVKSYTCGGSYDYNPNGYDSLIYESDSSFLDVQNYGYVNARTEQTGAATITVRSVNGVTRQTRVIVYNDEDIEGVAITGAPQYAGIYQTIPLTASVRLYGEEVANQLVTWESDNTRVASVNANGSVRTLGYGTATITATTPNGLTDSVTITVLKEPNNFTLPGSVTAVYDQPVQLAPATVTPGDAEMHISWSVEPEGLVEIDGDTLTAVVNENTTATLTAVNWDGSTRTTTLIVRIDPTRLQKLTLPAALTQIEEEAFAGTAAEYVVLPDACESIGARAFADSDSLQAIYIPANVTEIADDAFAGSERVTIYGVAGSEAERFAAAKDLPFVEQ